MAETKVTPAELYVTYSATTEQDTGKRWIDGRVIYRKVVSSGFSAIAGSWSVSHGISGITTNMQIVSLSGGMKIGSTNGSGSGSQSLFYRETAGNWCSVTGVDTTGIGMAGSYAWGASWLNVVLEYVK